MNKKDKKMGKIIDFKTKVEEETLEEIADVIRRDGLVVFPTETVYGIGANALSPIAIKKIYEAKGRPQDNPMIVHISDFDMLRSLTKKVNATQERLMKLFWPGPLTIIFEKMEEISPIVTGGLETIAIRMPSNEIAERIIAKAALPIAAPSANLSGKPSGTNIEDIKGELIDRVDLIVDGGDAHIGLESTVVKIVEDKVKILRPGKVTREELVARGFKLVEENSVLGKDEAPESPGMKYRHYAPKARAYLVDHPSRERRLETIKKMVMEEMGKCKKVCIIGCLENQDAFQEITCEYISYGSYKDLEVISHNIFSCLRKADLENVDLILIEGVETLGLGGAIMNRLIKAAEKVIRE